MQITPEIIDAVFKGLIALATIIIGGLQVLGFRKGRCTNAELDQTKKDLDIAYGLIRDLKGEEPRVRSKIRKLSDKRPIDESASSAENSGDA